MAEGERTEMATKASVDTLRSSGIYLLDANGHYWRLGVSVLGVVTSTDEGTDEPTGAIVGTPS